MDPYAPEGGADRSTGREPVEYGDKWSWRMPPLAELGRPQLSAGRRLWLGVLRGYLVLAVAMVVIRVVQLAVGH